MLALIGAFVMATSSIMGSTDITHESYPATEQAFISSQDKEKDQNVHNIVSIASQAYNVNLELMEGIIKCESSFNPGAIGDYGHSFGLVQIFLPAHPDISKEEALNPFFSAFYLAQQISLGHASMWSCYNLMHKT